MKTFILMSALLLALITTAGTASAGIILGPGWPLLPPTITPSVVAAPPAYYTYPYGYYSYPYGYYTYPYYRFRAWGPGYWGYGRGYYRGPGYRGYYRR